MAIYDKYSTPLFTYAYRCLGDSVLAEDCVADVFARFLSVITRAAGPRNHLRAYLYRSAHNWVVDTYRRNPDISLVLEEDSAIIPDSIDDYEMIEKQRRVRAALSKLTPEQQQVIMLYFYEGWKTEEIAAAIQKSVGAVRALQHRAVVRLQSLLYGEEDNA
ncbi:MAG: RNA polymerase sigma factor [Anaerolineaceae bacterium]